MVTLAPSSTPKARDSAIEKIEVKLTHLKKKWLKFEHWPRYWFRCLSGPQYQPKFFWNNFCVTWGSPAVKRSCWRCVRPPSHTSPKKRPIAKYCWNTKDLKFWSTPSSRAITWPSKTWTCWWPSQRQFGNCLIYRKAMIGSDSWTFRCSSSATWMNRLRR